MRGHQIKLGVRQLLSRDGHPLGTDSFPVFYLFILVSR